MPSIILIRGGGDLATGVAIRLIRSGVRVSISELPQPLAIRRTVSFAEAVYNGETSVEGVVAHCLKDPTDTLSILSVFGNQQVPVIVDPNCMTAQTLHPAVIVDARMIKKAPEPIGYSSQLYIGLGPGFIAGENCQAVVETRRGHRMGRVYFRGSPEGDTGQPDGNPARVLRSPCNGILVGHVEIGTFVEQGQIIAEVISEQQSVNKHSSSSVIAPFSGVLRGLLHPGLIVSTGMKIGDVDPRGDPQACSLVSDKALSVGGGVLEAILSRPDLRNQLWI
jgi:xanthine dehydrogenase accessory factor